MSIWISLNQRGRTSRRKLILWEPVCPWRALSSPLRCEDFDFHSKEHPTTRSLLIQRKSSHCPKTKREREKSVFLDLELALKPAIRTEPETPHRSFNPGSQVIKVQGMLTTCNIFLQKAKGSLLRCLRYSLMCTTHYIQKYVDSSGREDSLLS